MTLTISIKEVIRHLIGLTGLQRVHLRFRKSRGQSVDHLVLPNLRDRFASIYDNAVWSFRGGARSGFGSELVNTEEIRKSLPGLLQDLGVERMLDLGCGDWTWMKMLDLDVHYIGVDIVESVIQTNRANYSSDRREFLLLDATQEPIPKADIVLCREVLFHLSFEDAWKVLDNVRASGARWLIATTDEDTLFNADVPSGDFRRVNMARPPFKFPSPTRVIQDNAVSQARRLGVWEVASLPRASR